MSTKYKIGDYLLFKGIGGKVWINRINAIRLSESGSGVSYETNSGTYDEDDLHKDIKLLDFDKSINEQLQ